MARGGEFIGLHTRPPAACRPAPPEASGPPRSHQQLSEGPGLGVSQNSPISVGSLEAGSNGIGRNIMQTRKFEIDARRQEAHARFKEF
jgi:hypothetical protein